MSARLDSVLHHIRKVLGSQAEQGSDGDLLQRYVRHRDETAFELLLWRHAAMVLRVCQGVLRDGHASEDAFQATFLILARKAGSIGRGESLAAWLYQVAYRVAVRARLHAAERRALEASQHERRRSSAHAGPSEAATERDLVPLVHEELNRLAAKYRTPIVLCYLEGKTHAEAADQLGWAKGTVSGRLARGREMLRKRLVRRGIVFPVSVLAVALAASKASAVPPALVAATAQAAMAVAAGNVAAAGVSAGVIYLTQGVVQAMCLSKLKATAAAVIAFLLIFAGAGALLRLGVVEASAQRAATADRLNPVGGRSWPAPPAMDDNVYSADASGPGAAAGSPDLAGQQSRIDSRNNLKQIALAVHSYSDTYGVLPSDITDDEGQPLLSWRVALLPFLEQGDLYRQFKLDEAWDSPHNIKLLARMPKVYSIATDADEMPDQATPGGPTGRMVPGREGPGGPGGKIGAGGSKGGMMPGGPPGAIPGMPFTPGRFPGAPPGPQDTRSQTHYQAFVGKNTVFPRGTPIRLVDITDGTSNTILVIEAANAVPWTKPQDLPYSAKRPIPALGVFPDVIQAVFADGAAHGLRPDYDEKEMRKAIVRDDGEVIDLDKLDLPQVARGGPPGMPGGPAMGPPGMPAIGGPGGMAPGGPGMPGVADMGRPPADPRLKQIYNENQELKKLLQETLDRTQEIRAEMDQMKQQFAAKRDAQRLMNERETLKKQIEQATSDLKALRDEFQRLRDSLQKE
jgi:RNA polymerase sigma factor (sigma-70 family)